MLRTSLVSLCVVSIAGVASAQGTEPAGDPAADPVGAPADPAAPPAVEAAAPIPDASAQIQPAPPPPVEEGTTLRNGFSLSAGQEFGTSESGIEYSGQLFGIDWRIGAQINKALGVYLQSHLSLGTVKEGMNEGITGNFATAVVAEYTLPMRLYFGGGAGYGVLNNPSGPLVQARVGYYPFEKTSQGKARRLNVAFDARVYFTDYAGGLTMKHLALSLGYDRF